MNLPDELAAESMRQLLVAMRDLPHDASVAQRLPLVNEASRLLERTTTKLNTVTRLGDQRADPPGRGHGEGGDTAGHELDAQASPHKTANP